ncbi:MAG TPA: hypothetical protein VD813_03895 [Pseudonocardia sp.]|nr:hypothetical protein [Pseudonocardia sp.]
MRAGLEQLGWLLTGTPPHRIGWGPGPLTTARRAVHRARHALGGRPLRLALLEHPQPGTAFGAAMAFWINRRSGKWTARLHRRLDGRLDRAELVWVFSQDPLGPAARAWLDRRLAGLPAGVPVLNPPATHGAYHRDDAFPRLAAAGVRVPRTAFGTEDLGRTPVVYKAAGEQGSRKEREPYRGPRAGFRAFAAEDGRGADGLHRRYRAFVLGDLVLPEDVIAAPVWNACARTLVTVERSFALIAHERAQLLLLTRTLGLDFAAVDFLRRRSDGLPVFLDVNVYPTVAGAWPGGMPARDRGQWHVFDNAERLGLPPPGGRPVWEQVDEALARLAGSGPVGGYAPAGAQQPAPPAAGSAKNVGESAFTT